MKKTNIVFLSAILLFTAAVYGQVKRGSGSDETAYKEFVAKVKAGDTSVDFKAMRVAFSKTKAYSPYGGLRDDRSAAYAALDKKNYKDAVKKAEAMLNENYVDMHAHIAASVGYAGLGNDAKADFHKRVYLGLINSVRSSGDGKTAATAYVVISTDEEYSMLQALGLPRAANQSLNQIDGHAFDILTVTDPKTNAPVKIFFNIDISWKAETEMFK